jgi:hypothetical protein
MIGGLLKTVQRRRWSRALHHFNGVVVLSSTVSTTLVALLFQDLLCLRVCEPEEQFHSIFGDVVEFTQHFLGDFTCLETVKMKSDCVAAGDNLATEHLPSETDLLADARFLVTADLFGDNTVRLEMMPKVLDIY